MATVPPPLPHLTGFIVPLLPDKLSSKWSPFPSAITQLLILIWFVFAHNRDVMSKDRKAEVRFLGREG